MSQSRAAAYAAYPPPTDVETGEPMDDWGYADQGREGFLAGWDAAINAVLALTVPVKTEAGIFVRATVDLQALGLKSGVDRG